MLWNEALEVGRLIRDAIFEHSASLGATILLRSCLELCVGYFYVMVPRLLRAVGSTDAERPSLDSSGSLPYEDNGSPSLSQLPCMQHFSPP